MTSRDDDRPGDDTTPRPLTERRPGQRRARVAAGVAGLTVVLGGGAYVTTSALLEDGSATTSDVTAQQEPVRPASSESAGSPDIDTATAGSPAAPAPTVDAAGAPVPSEIVEEVQKARENMAKDGVEVQRPAIAKPTSPVIKEEDIEQTTTGKLAEGGTVRVVAAEGDLTGQRELGWVAGGITKHRGVDCSQTFKFATSPVPTKKPNLLICWRTSPKKSVAALVTDIDGKPSKDKAVASLEKKWRSMG